MSRWSYSSAAADVIAERARQVNREQFSPEGDDRYTQGQLACAGAAYALGAAGCALVEPSDLWPWAPSWWKPRDCRSDLVRAAALIIAEIERLDRTAPQTALPTADWWWEADDPDCSRYDLAEVMQHRDDYEIVELCGALSGPRAFAFLAPSLTDGGWPREALLFATSAEAEAGLAKRKADLDALANGAPVAGDDAAANSRRPAEAE